MGRLRPGQVVLLFQQGSEVAQRHGDIRVTWPQCGLVHRQRFVKVLLGFGELTALAERHRETIQRLGHPVVLRAKDLLAQAQPLAMHRLGLGEEPQLPIGFPERYPDDGLRFRIALELGADPFGRAIQDLFQNRRIAAQRHGGLDPFQHVGQEPGHMVTAVGLGMGPSGVGFGLDPESRLIGLRGLSDMTQAALFPLGPCGANGLPGAHDDARDQHGGNRADSGKGSAMAARKFFELVKPRRWTGDDGLVIEVTLDVFGKGNGAFVPSGAILLQRLHHDPIQVATDLTGEFRRLCLAPKGAQPGRGPGRLLLADSAADFLETGPAQFLPIEWQPAGQQFVKQHAEAVDVASRIDVGPGGLLRAHVDGRAQEQMGLGQGFLAQALLGGFGDSEVNHPRGRHAVVARD